MSLVNYDSDDSDGDVKEADIRPADEPVVAEVPAVPSDAVAMETEPRVSQVQETMLLPLQLPDVDLLFGPSSSSGSPGVSLQRKRESVGNGYAHQLPSRKIPRGNLRPARTLPDTAGGVLMPPQLRGRSNVATEDLDKIFTRRLQRQT